MGKLLELRCALLRIKNRSARALFVSAEAEEAERKLAQLMLKRQEKGRQG